METQEKPKTNRMSMILKGSACGIAALGAAVLGIASTFAVDYNMAGPALDANFVTGAKGGLGDAVATIQTTLNNQFLVEVAILFIGLAVVVGLIMGVVKGHRRI